MKTSPNGMNLIEQFEGLRLSVYKDSAGIPTIGYGSTYYQNGTRVKMGDPSITKEQATALFHITLTSYENNVNAKVTSAINQNQFDALVSLCYNIGPGNFNTSTVLKLVNVNPQNPAITEAFSRWNKAGGQVVQGLVTRRAKEAAYYFMAV